MLEIGKIYRTKDGTEAHVVGELKDMHRSSPSLFVGFTKSGNRLTPMIWSPGGNWFTANAPSKELSIRLEPKLTLAQRTQLNALAWAYKTADDIFVRTILINGVTSAFNVTSDEAIKLMETPHDV